MSERGRLRDLPPRPRRHRGELEPRRRAAQGLSRRRDHRPPLLHLLHGRGPAGRAPGDRARAGRSTRDGGRTRAGGSARTAPGSGPTSSSPACAATTATLRGFAKVTRDLTDRKRSEDALRGVLEREREAAEQLRGVDRMRRELVAMIAHDLRGPVSVVLEPARPAARPVGRARRRRAPRAGGAIDRREREPSLGSPTTSSTWR